AGDRARAAGGARMMAARIETWLAARQPSRPASLTAQMTRLIADCPRNELNAAGSMADAMGALGAFTVRRVSNTEASTPDLALELLAADACVTYAFEAAAEEGVEVVSLAQRLLSANEFDGPPRADTRSAPTQSVRT